MENWKDAMRNGNFAWQLSWQVEVTTVMCKGRKRPEHFRASPELKARQMLGNPRGINWHIKHNITSSAGAQSLVLSGELLYYVFLPQFKSQELEANTAQALWAHSARHRGAVCTQHRRFLYMLPNILRGMNVKSFGLQPPTRAPDCLWTPNLRCKKAKLFNNKQRCIVYIRGELFCF